MIVECQKCQTRFRVKDEMIAETGTTVRCSKCKSVFKVYPETAAQPEPQPTAQPSQPEPQAQDANPLMGGSPDEAFEFVYADENSSTDHMSEEVFFADEDESAAVDDPFEEDFEPTSSGEVNVVEEQKPLAAEIKAEDGVTSSEDEFGDEFENFEHTEPGLLQSPADSNAPNTAQAAEQPPHTSPYADSEPSAPVAANGGGMPESAKSVSLPKAVGLEQRKMTRYRGKKRAQTTAARKIPVKRPSKFQGVLFHSIVVSSVVVTLILGTAARGVRLWKPGEVYWLVKKQFVSKVRGPVVVDYEGLYLDRENGETFFVIRGVLQNRSGKTVNSPEIRLRLSSKGEISVPQEELYPCCLEISLGELRQVTSIEELNELRTAKANQKPLKPDESRPFMLVTVPEFKPSHFRAEIVRQ